MRRIRYPVFLNTVLMLLCVWAAPLAATVVLRLDFASLVAQSALIFRGAVVERVVERQGDMVYTTVTFAIDETLKGDAGKDTVALRFLGGSVDALTIDVEGQFIPAPGDAGVYFVATQQQEQVNPLSGWQQGYFPLLQDATGTDYLDMRQRPDFVIPGVDDDPLLAKMQNLGFSAEQIEARFPQALWFSWPDFRDAVAAEVAGTASTGAAP